MTRLTIKVDGELVRQGLQDLSADVPKIGTLQIYRASQAVVKRMKDYPPQPMGSTYVRTYILWGSWKIERQGNKGYAIKSDAVQQGRHYTPYVVGDAYGNGQAQQNRHWPLFRTVVEDEIGKLPPDVEDEIQLAARRRGLHP